MSTPIDSKSAEGNFDHEVVQRFETLGGPRNGRLRKHFSTWSRMIVGAIVVVTLVSYAPSSGAAERVGDETNNTAHLVVGFGDSVAAGYGLSKAAELPTKLKKQQYPNGIGCSGNSSTDLAESYPCVLAKDVGDDVQGSRNFAVQGATSSDVLTPQIPEALKVMPSAAVRAQVNYVTLTVGADDIDFAHCLTEEFEAETDSCLAGTISNLSLNQPTAASLTGPNGLEANLEKIFAQLNQDFPDARIYVTNYYQPVPGPSAIPCGQFAVPALAAISNNLGGLSTFSKAVSLVAYLTQLNQYVSAYQDRFYTVATYLEAQQLNPAIKSAATTAFNSGLPVINVPLAAQFSGHGICAGSSSRVFGLYLETKGSTVLDVTASGSPVIGRATISALSEYKCPFPYPPSEKIIKLDFKDKGGSYSFLASSNCISHPTVTGQETIARAIQTAPLPAASCTSAALFQAAVTKEHINVNDPGYGGTGPTPGAFNVACNSDWAIAVISRPRVGTTDGTALFHFVSGKWQEVTQLPSTDITCALAENGVPSAIASALLASENISSSGGCASSSTTTTTAPPEPTPTTAPAPTPTPSTTTTTTPPSPGATSPSATVQAFLGDYASGNYSAACSLYQPDGPTILFPGGCEGSLDNADPTSLTGTSIGTVQTEGNEALVVVEASGCTDSFGNPCLTNSDPNAGLDGGEPFSQLYYDAVSEDDTDPPQAMGAGIWDVPCVEENGSWYIGTAGGDDGL